MTDAKDPAEHPELTELEPLEPIEELPSESEPVQQRPEGSDAAAPAQAPGTGSRELEKAPLMLRKAAVILTIAALFPWVKLGGWDLMVLLSKGVILLGGLMHYWSVLNKHDDPVPGAVKALGGLHPKALDLIGLVLVLVGVAPVIDAPFSMSALVEKAAVGVGFATWVQVLAYEKGGKFNPVMGLVMPLLGIAAIGRIGFLIKQFEPFAMIGSLGVLAAGGLAGYTMVIAMKEAKAHGEAKKRAAMEERKRQRQASRGQSGGGPKSGS